MARTGGLRARYQVEEAASRGQERTLSITLGDWGGAEMRPTRMFVWVGPRERGVERLLTTGREPKLLRGSRKRRHLDLRRLSLSYLGNPAMTLALLGYNMVRRRAAGAGTSGARDPSGRP